ncbi:MAG TPA: hypothetical protein VMG10_27725 [Gemmataceae bacterium]|nr:hypothetical protein [Gemmataceae bacterium]
MFATEFPAVTIPSWVERVALPKYPIMPLAGYVLLGLGALLLLIGYFAPIKKLPALTASLALMAYYPLSYLALWFLFRFDEKTRADREPNKFEEFLFDHTHVLDWSILGACAFFGFVFFVLTVWLTVRKHRRVRVKEAATTDNSFAAQPAARPVSPPQPAAARPTAPRPAAPPQVPQVKKVSKKPPAPPPSDNPFNFG